MNFERVLWPPKGTYCFLILLILSWLILYPVVSVGHKHFTICRVMYSSLLSKNSCLLSLPGTDMSFRVSRCCQTVKQKMTYIWISRYLKKNILVYFLSFIIILIECRAQPQTKKENIQLILALSPIIILIECRAQPQTC